MKKIFLKFHLWLAVPFGIIVTIICFSGAMLVFEPEIVNVLRHDQIYVDNPRHTVLPVDEIVRKVEQTLPSDVKVTGVTMYSDPNLSYKVNLSKPRRAAMYVDQYTGQLKGLYERPAFFDFMQRLHRWLLDSRDDSGGVFWGRTIVGISTIMFVLVLLSGVVIWWPRTARMLRNSLKITTSKSRHLLWRSLHVAGGMYVLLLLLTMALTGLTWSFTWYSKGFNALFGVREVEKSGAVVYAEQQAKDAAKAKNKTGEAGDKDGKGGKATDVYAEWQTVYDTLRARNVNFDNITVSDGTADVAFGGLGNQRAADKYKFNPADGRITSVALYADGDISSKIRGWILSVHIGNWGGLFTRILWFVAALFGATLPVTGYYLWIRRLRRRSRG